MAKQLVGKIAVVTGASRGIGRGIAVSLGEAGAKVYITGRKPEQSLAKDNTKLPKLEEVAKEIENRGGQASVIYTDHSDMLQVKSLFDQIDAETNGKLDILVNNAYSGVPAISQNIGKKFYEQDPEIWDTINNVGLRNNYFCSVYATKIMKKNGSGLIINVSSAGALRYLFNVAYGVGKAGVDRLSIDTATELQDENITVMSIWPGVVKTELATENSDNIIPSISKSQNLSEETVKSFMESGESVEYCGRAIVALAADPNVHKMTGKILTTADLGDKYGFTDVDGRRIDSMRSLSVILTSGILGVPFGKCIGKWIPRWVKVPGWIMSAHESHL